VSHFYELKAGVRQGGVLSPILFSIYIDGLVSLVYRPKTHIGCKIGAICTGIFMYADDIILLAPSIHALQSMVNLCELKLDFICVWLLMLKKSDLLVCALDLGIKIHVQV